MSRIIGIMAIVAVGCANLAGAENWRHGERQPLWPEGRIPDFQEQQIAEMTDVAPRVKEVKPGFVPAEHRMPYIEWFEAPKNANGACFILISGGGYGCCCDVKLVKSWKETFTSHGYQTVNLVYRTPRPKGLPIYQSAWEDGQRAVRMVRSQAKARGFNPEKIGVIGMSAGGHLVTLLATSALMPTYAKVDELDELPCHVNVAIANAPAYNTLGGADGSARPQDGVTVVPKINPVFAFDAKTCPISFHHGGMDPYTPNGSTLCYRELRKRKIPAELHLYADKPHGAYGLERAIEFLNQIEFAKKLAPTVKLMDRYASDGARDPSRYAKENVWPAGKMPDVRTNQCTPYIEWHFPKSLKTKAIQIIYSGGAYGGNSPDSFEVAPMRRFLNEKGMTVVTMKYRTPRPQGLPKHKTAWEDLQRAIRIVRSKAKAEGLDPDRIGIMGSSAGGHLTLMGMTSSRQRAYEPIDELDKISCKVQWGIAIYPAYALTDGLDKFNTGNDDSAVLAPELLFDMDTPPALFIHGDKDVWASMNSVKAWEQMRRMNIQSELHTLALRPHCFQRQASPGTGSYTWMNRAWEFLTAKGFNR